MLCQSPALYMHILSHQSVQQTKSCTPNDIMYSALITGMALCHPLLHKCLRSSAPPSMLSLQLYSASWNKRTTNRSNNELNEVLTRPNTFICKARSTVIPSKV
mmetsp:Transcript_120448/g.302754  ORF Transcript_120448/g.302754 Transcript_120448/m.302754 type:complete len:103 (-) Transcript_120448:1759-2067(-)